MKVPKLGITKPGDDGAVLLTVLLMVAVMSTVLVVVLDDLRFALRLEANRQVRSQAYWYAVGAESLATRALETSWRQRPGRHDDNDPWVTTPFILPIEGGRIVVRLSDAGNCFNLNSVVEDVDGGTFQRSELGVALFANLLEALDFPEAEQVALTNALVDWIDSDGAPQTAGGEDSEYARETPPYRTANTLLASFGELRTIAGYTPEVMARLRRFVCVHPDPTFSRINPNTMTPEEAVLIQMLAGDELREVDARSLIENRPANGFLNVADFWERPVFDGLDLPQQVKVLVSMRTSYFDLRSRVVYENATFDLSSRLAMTAAGEVEVEWRRYGEAS